MPASTHPAPRTTACPAAARRVAVVVCVLAAILGSAPPRRAAAQPPPGGPSDPNAEPSADDDDEEEDDAAEEEDGDEPAPSPYEPNEEPPESTSEPRTICHGRLIRRIEVAGARRVDEDDIRATMRLRRGLPCTDDEVSRDARAIWELGFFDDLIIEAEPSGENEVALIVRVTERPAIAHVVFEGNDEVDDDDIEDKIDLHVGSVLSVPQVRRQIEKIREVYADEGYFLARIRYELRRVENDRNEVDVVFLIEEGEEVTVRRITFTGNDHVPASELRSIMQTNQTSFLSFISSNDNFDREAFDEDVMRIQAWYYDKGYLEMRVGTPRTELSPDRRYIDVTIPVEEGRRYRIGEMTVRELGEGDAAIDPLRPASELRGEVDLDRGEWFSRTSIAEGLQEITRIYRDAGYARVEVSPDTALHERERVVDVSVTIRRGPLVRIERIEVRGNTKTRDSVIRREIPIFEGDLYSQTDLETAKTRIQQLGYFERVDFSEEEGSAPDRMVVNVEVSERSTGTFQVGAGFSSLERFLVTAQIQQQNLFGNGQTLSLQLQLSGIRQLVQLDFLEPYFLGTRWTLGLNAFKTVRQFASFNQDSTGGALMFGHPLFNNNNLRFFVQYRLEKVKIGARVGGFLGSGAGGALFNALPQVVLANTQARGITSSARFTLTWDSRDNRIYSPTSGFYSQYSVQVADSYLGSQNVFIRQSAFWRMYRKLFGPFVLRVNTELGLITSRVGRGVPLFERFYLGGIYNVRGYRFNALGPRSDLCQIFDPSCGSGSVDGVPIGGNFQAFYNIEIEFPIVTSVGIRGVIFTDGGNTWNLESRLCDGPRTDRNDPANNPCGFDPFRIRTSWGFGLRWFSPLGPLRFEWGIPIHRRPNEGKVDFQFTIGNAF